MKARLATTKKTALARVQPDTHCNGRKRDGTLCKSPAGARTDHPGQGRCSWHGGKAANHGSRALVHGWASQVQHTRVSEILDQIAKIDHDAMDLVPELNLLRAMTVDWINRYDVFVDALMAWYEDPESNSKPRRILDITDAASLVESISRVAQRLHQIQSEGSISMETFKRVTENMGMIVARYVKDPLVLNRIEFDWMQLAMDSKKAPAALPPHVETETIDAVPHSEEKTQHGQESLEGRSESTAHSAKPRVGRSRNQAVSPGA